MSDLYKNVNGKKVRLCKYECGTSVAWDDNKSYFIEVDYDNVQHTKERCIAFKEKQKQEPTTQTKMIPKEEITLQMVLGKLESIGIKVDLEELFK